MTEHGKSTAENAPAPSEPRRRRRIRLAEMAAAIFGLIGIGYVLCLATHHGTSNGVTDQGATAKGAYRAKPGLWGELEFVPMTISAPEESLPVRTLAEGRTQWFFPGLDLQKWDGWLTQLEVPEELRKALAKTDAAQATAQGLVVFPPSEALEKLSEKAKRAICRVLRRQPGAGQAIGKVPKERLAKLRDEGVSATAIELLRRVGCEDGTMFYFFDLGEVLRRLPSPEEKVRLCKALTLQPTLLARLHVRQGSDINGLMKYWGKACWTSDLRSILESLSRVPGGVWVDMVELMPPFPSSLIYTYPKPLTPMAGPAVKQDCHWTSFNYFRDPPEPRFGTVEFVRQTLANDYLEVQGDPRYGDIALFCTKDAAGTIVHSAVYLADNVLFTKNGDTLFHPWMLATLESVLEEYATDGDLQVLYFRNKYY